jgi:dTDP-L-rhamnose 4-epimerase
MTSGMNVLVTGGAGFIGTHLVRRMLREGCSVAILDNFTHQVHGGVQELPTDLVDHVELYRGDVRERELVARALEGRDVLVHLAAETGTGQSMYEVTRYQDANIGGTAAVVDCLANGRKSSIQKVLVASSRAIYGEGRYRCAEHGGVYPGPRLLNDLRAGQYEPRCPSCNTACIPEATPEDAPAHATSFYGLTKYVQEEMVRMFGRACGFSAYALRYQNVYGPGQSLCNPYTGILAIFSSLARSSSAIQVFEDGQESRDFIFIDDAVEATWQILVREQDANETFNVGTGQPTNVIQVASEIVGFFGGNSTISVTGAFRQGDIRHNFADLSKIQRSTGFRARFNFRNGLQKFLEWATEQESVPVQYESSLREMRDRGLFDG